MPTEKFVETRDEAYARKRAARLSEPSQRKTSMPLPSNLPSGRLTARSHRSTGSNSSWRDYKQQQQRSGVKLSGAQVHKHHVCPESSDLTHGYLAAALHDHGGVR